MPALHELNKGFEDAIKDQEFLDEYAYYCKHYIGRPSPLYFAEGLTNSLGGAKILFKQEHLNHTGSHKINNSLFQVLLARRMGKSHLICESGAGQHFSATAAVAAKFSMPLITYVTWSNAFTKSAFVNFWRFFFFNSSWEEATLL